MSNDTKLLLGIEDSNITIKTNSTQINPVTEDFEVHGVLDYRPKACPRCGVINDHSMMGEGWRTTRVRLPKSMERAVWLILKRHYFKCAHCGKRSLAQTPLVNHNCTISINSRLACLEKLTDTVSLKHIADELSISTATVLRILRTAHQDLTPDYSSLPEALLLDEIKTTKSANGAMSFEIMDANKHTLLDLLAARTTYHIEQYFRKYSLEARKQVRFIVTDMNYTYPKLAGTI